MSVIRAFAVIGWQLSLYLLYRIHLRRERPSLRASYQEARVVFAVVLGWKSKISIRGAEHCPKHGPAIFVANHVRADDPVLMSEVIHRASDGGIQIHYMMRDDFFAGTWMKNRLFDLDEMTGMFGAVGISRDSVRLSQMRPFVELLKSGETFVMYPMGTRTRSGVLVEYRTLEQEPGGASFFAIQAQRKEQPGHIPLVPLVRTLDITNDKSTIIFGEPGWPTSAMSREQRASFDAETIAKLGNLVEINSANLLCIFLYIVCLHGVSGRRSIQSIIEQLQRLLSELSVSRYVNAGALSNTDVEVRRVLRYLELKGLVSIDGDILELMTERILHAPAPAMHYRKENPLRYLANQLLHFADVVDAVERMVLPAE